MKRHIFTSESVTEGHPDKMCDKISDSILDEILSRDPDARVACETAVTTGLVLVMGEITTSCYVDIPRIVRETVKKIGYTRAKYGFDCETCSVLTSIDEQSGDIKQGVDKSFDDISEQGAGDQGLMFGYACNETDELMPYPIVMAHKLAMQLTKVRKDKTLRYLRPDGKTQVSVEYIDGKPARIHTIVIAAQHDQDTSQEKIRQDIKKEVIDRIVDPAMIDEDTIIHINRTGKFAIGGPQGDAGLTGRKIIVDTYGGMGRHGGGAFSGKDPSKVDRSAAYAARWVAKNIVAAGLADKCEVQLAYCIGVAKPVSIDVNTFDTSKVSETEIAAAVGKVFDLTPGAIIRRLGLKAPIYSQVAAYGHFGRNDLDLPWEKTDMIEKLLQAIK
ncbi:MAG TPA: methionine adenosyltransferase [Clostridia bacterium]|nr:methionine adenosyltransferase [Clostridia bacterium]HRX41645.1 methionine adenosyltransferase [Clostridia bacterium]